MRTSERWLRVASVALMLALSQGCGGSGASPETGAGGGGTDAEAEPTPDAQSEVSAPDAPPEASAAADAASEAETIPEAAPDDANTEQPADAANDIGPDGGSDAPSADVAVDAADSSLEADAPIEVGECSPGTTECQGNVLRTCDGTAHWTESPCQFVCQQGACEGVCTPGSKQCSGGAAQTCNAAGQWQTTETCPYACALGECTGVCTPGAKQCLGPTLETCDGTGQWQTTATCPFACYGDTCTGTCVPGTKDCVGATPRSCDATGAWVSGSPCSFACAQGQCSGSCVPGSQQCNGTTIQDCDSGGIWKDGTVCPFVCQNAACVGTCVPGSLQCQGSTALSCSATGQWQTVATCQYACVQGQCTGNCVPGTHQCNGVVPQTCTASGQWQDGTVCPYLCAQGYCGGVCKPGTKECLAGLDTRTCDINGQWQSGPTCGSVPNAVTTCAAGVCGFLCNGGFSDCDLNAQNGCESQPQTDLVNCGTCGTICPTAPHATTTCTAGKCGYACLSGYTDCDGAAANGCEVAFGTDSANCGSCGRACCGGGACVSGHCKQTQLPGLLSAIFDVDDSSVYFTGGTGMRKAPVQTAAPATDLVVNLTGWTLTDIATNGSTVFWTMQRWLGGSQDTGVWGVPVAGGVAIAYEQTNSTNGVSDRAVTYDPNNVFWMTNSLVVRWHSLLDSSGGIAYPWSVNSYADIVSDGTYLYATYSANSSVWRTPVHGGTRTEFLPVGTGNIGYSSLATDGSHIYTWHAGTAAKNYADRGIWKAPVNGGTPTQIYQGWGRPGLATDGTWVFFNGYEGTPQVDTLVRISVNGGCPVTLISGCDGSTASLNRPRHNARCVYCGGGYTINKVP